MTDDELRKTTSSELSSVLAELYSMDAARNHQRIAAAGAHFSNVKRRLRSVIERLTGDAPPPEPEKVDTVGDVVDAWYQVWDCHNVLLSNRDVPPSMTEILEFDHMWKRFSTLAKQAHGKIDA